MPKVFEQFHFSLIEREQPDMFEPPVSREEWLRRAFGARFQFRHMGNQFHWVPQELAAEFIVGVIERKTTQHQRKPPEEGAAEFEGEIWQGSLVIIDPKHHPDGQKVAVEDKVSVGQPKALLSSLVGHVNADASNQYALFFKPLFRGDSFRKFAERHGGSLQYVAFKFTVPNMIFGVGTKVVTGLKRIGKDTGAQEVDLRLESDDGVDANSNSVKEAVDYAEDGNARVTAKAITGEYWSSTKRKLTVKMHSILDFANAKKEQVQSWLNQALDRGPDNSDSGSDRSGRGGDSE